MNIQVSIGEAIDKYNILEIKKRKITDENKLIEIEKELDALSLCKPIIIDNNYYYKLLTYVNTVIWNLTDSIKKMDINNPSYSTISFKIFEFNQKRFRLKHFFNSFINSNIKEQKSYDTTYCKLIINNEQDLYNKITEINYMTIEFDYVYIIINYNIRYPLQNIFKSPNIIYNDKNENIRFHLIANVSSITIDSTIIPIFEFPYLNYICGGLFGDLIQSISVINEKFYSSGKKGNLYIAEGVYNNRQLEPFRFGIDNTYKDTFDVISSQKYIHSYHIYNNEKIDIDLNNWRSSPILHTQNWFSIYNNCYNIKWGYSKWMCVEKDPQWNDTVFINMTSYRFPNNVNFNLLYSKYGKSLVFISPTEDNYNYFKQQTSLNIELYSPKTFTELCIAIASCKLLIGGLSSILSIGHALQIPRIILNGEGTDKIRNNDLNKIWKNVYYDIPPDN